jgi:hypothetical protein
MAANQLKRKELLKKEDGFITFLNSSLTFITDNKKKVIITTAISYKYYICKYSIIQRLNIWLTWVVELILNLKNEV